MLCMNNCWRLAIPFGAFCYERTHARNVCVGSGCYILYINYKSFCLNRFIRQSDSFLASWGSLLTPHPIARRDNLWVFSLALKLFRLRHRVRRRIFVSDAFSTEKSAKQFRKWEQQLHINYSAMNKSLAFASSSAKAVVVLKSSIKLVANAYNRSTKANSSSWHIADLLYRYFVFFGITLY